MSATTKRRLPRLPFHGRVAVIGLCTLALHVAAVRAATPAPVISGDPTAERVVSLVTAGDGQLTSYVVPLHIVARVHELITFHVKLDGTVYFKRPGRVALDMHLVPQEYRRMFAALGTPLLWSQTYEFSTDSVTHEPRTWYHLRGTPRAANGPIALVLLDVPEDRSEPMMARWTCADGTSITERVFAGSDGTYSMPHRAEVELTVDGAHVHADLQYGDYALNGELSDSVFAGS